ncbi:hypothetical protein F5887DRAFT_1235486 [Amanita rubescens]|nr:hypothetical protein F5887DRAFT_1235486 [Amanita rubescens]
MYQTSNVFFFCIAHTAIPVEVNHGDSEWRAAEDPVQSVTEDLRGVDLFHVFELNREPRRVVACVKQIFANGTHVANLPAYLRLCFKLPVLYTLKQTCLTVFGRAVVVDPFEVDKDAGEPLADLLVQLARFYNALIATPTSIASIMVIFCMAFNAMHIEILREAREEKTLFVDEPYERGVEGGKGQSRGIHGLGLDLKYEISNMAFGESRNGGAGECSVETVLIALGYGRSSSPLMHTVNVFFSIMLLAETCPARDSIPIQYVHLGLAQHATEVNQNLPELSQLQDRHDKDTLAVIGIFD